VATLPAAGAGLLAVGVRDVPAELLIKRPARSRVALRDHAAAKPWYSDAGPYASCSLSSSAMVSRLLATFLRRMTVTTGGGATSITNLAVAFAFAMTIDKRTRRLQYLLALAR
jgi:hypothetical protein